MTYKPIANFNNGLILDVKNSVLNKHYTFFINILKTTEARDLKKYIRANTILEYT